jgi:4-hydroxybenzoate polyprenyltransferase
MNIKRFKQLKHVTSKFLEYTDTFFFWYYVFVFVFGIMTLLVFIPFFGTFAFHFFTAFVALSFGGFLCYLSFAMAIVLICNQYIRKASKRKTKKQQIIQPTELLTMVLIFALFVGGYGGIKSGVRIIKNNILQVPNHIHNDSK